MSDHSLESEIMRTLAGNRRIRVDEIAVQAFNGDVLLRGTVESVLERAEVVRTVRRVPGVRVVEDWLRLRVPTEQEHADAETEAAVLGALIANDELHASDMDVHARGGAVTLRGVVEHPFQHEAAERIARGVGGVTHVRNQLRLLEQADADDVAERVTDAIGADAIAGISELTVTVNDEVVTLAGTVRSPGERDAALAAAAGAPGVAEVRDQITISPRAR